MHTSGTTGIPFTCWEAHTLYYLSRIYTDQFKFHVLELSKLRNKKNPEGDLEQGMKFLGGRKKEDFKMMAEQNKYIDEAYLTLTKLSADERKRVEYEARRRALYDYNTQMGSAERRRMEKAEVKDERKLW